MTAPLLPGGTLGFLGGGQLARMTALAARSMGYRVIVLDPDPACAAAPVADEVVVGAFDDPGAARRLAGRADRVSYEIERIAPEVLAAVADLAPLRPGPAVLTTVQDRARQKRFLEAHGHPVGPWRPVSTPAELAAAVRDMGPCRVKRTRDGYDGRGQVRLVDADGAAAAMGHLGGPCVAEQELDLAAELSVLVARSGSGTLAVHPPALNWHEDGILRYSLLPAPMPATVLRQAAQLAERLAEELDLVGVLVVECFLTTDGQLRVNELAPRPHNTYHHAEAACQTGQFEQYVRALCDLPLGATGTRGAALLVNLLGDLWADGEPAFAEVLAVPGVSLHLYGKAPRPGRKVGHLTVRADSADQAFQRAEQALRPLGPARLPPLPGGAERLHPPEPATASR